MSVLTLLLEFGREEYLVSGMGMPLLSPLGSDIGTAKTATVTAMVMITLESIEQQMWKSSNFIFDLNTSRLGCKKDKTDDVSITFGSSKHV
jgi:hypothetical protein